MRDCKFFVATKGRVEIRSGCIALIKTYGSHEKRFPAVPGSTPDHGDYQAGGFRETSASRLSTVIFTEAQNYVRYERKTNLS